MAIERIPGSKNWRVNLYQGKGKPRYTKSLNTSDKATALMLEKTIKDALKRRRTEETAIRIIKDVVSAKRDEYPLKGLASTYMTLHRRYGIAITDHELGARLGAIDRMAMYMLGTGKANNVNEITTREAWDFQTSLGLGEKYEEHVANHKREIVRVSCPPLKVKSRNNLVSRLSTIWKMMLRDGIVTENPWTHARASRIASEESHGRAFTRDEERRILASTLRFGHGMYEACIIARDTGLRYTDVYDLRWSSIKEDSIELTPIKTMRFGRKVFIPMSNAIREVISKLPKGDPNDKVLPDLPNMYWKLPGTNIRAFGFILRDAGIEAGEGECMSFHNWRNTFTSRLAEAGVSQDVRMKLCGWTTKSMEALYNTDKTQLQSAINALDKHTTSSR